MASSIVQTDGGTAETAGPAAGRPGRVRRLVARPGHYRGLRRAVALAGRYAASRPHPGSSFADRNLRRRPESARRWKLLAQIVATLPIALSGCGLTHLACCGWTIDLGILGPAVTVLWLIVGINALNLIDGMDGMASLTGLCICLTAAALDIQSGGSHVGTFTLGLAGRWPDSWCSIFHRPGSISAIPAA